jgi:hypothetical protein
MQFGPFFPIVLQCESKPGIFPIRDLNLNTSDWFQAVTNQINVTNYVVVYLGTNTIDSKLWQSWSAGPCLDAAVGMPRCGVCQCHSLPQK